jgi:hypothetical protein
MKDDFEDICEIHSLNTNCDPVFWKELEPKQLKLVQSIVSRFRTRSSVKEMVLDEVKYASEKKDSVGLYKREWKFVVEALQQKYETKGARNKEEIEYLLRVLNRAISMDMK